MATWQRPAGSANAPLHLSLPCLLPLLSASVFTLTEKTLISSKDSFFPEASPIPSQKAGWALQGVSRRVRDDAEAEAVGGVLRSFPFHPGQTEGTCVGGKFATTLAERPNSPRNKQNRFNSGRNLALRLLEDVSMPPNDSPDISNGM